MHTDIRIQGNLSMLVLQCEYSSSVGKNACYYSNWKIISPNRVVFTFLKDLSKWPLCRIIGDNHQNTFTLRFALQCEINISSPACACTPEAQELCIMIILNLGVI